EALRESTRNCGSHSTVHSAWKLLNRQQYRIAFVAVNAYPERGVAGGGVVAQSELHYVHSYAAGLGESGFNLDFSVAHQDGRGVHQAVLRRGGNRKAFRTLMVRRAEA